jgi:hypothetical protein
VRATSSGSFPPKKAIVGVLLGELRQPDGLGRLRGPSKSRCAARNKGAYQRVSTLQPSLVSTSARRLRRLVSQGSHTLQADELKAHV